MLDDRPTARTRRWFLAGVFLCTFASLVLEVLNVRLLSVLAWYHISFFAVSLAMFGVSAGAVRVFLGGAKFEGEGARVALGHYALAFALSIPLSHVAVLHDPFQLDHVTTAPLSVAAIGLLTAALLAAPFYLCGIVLAIALTRMPVRIGLTYAFDLAGGALGCVVTVPLLARMDVSSATFVAAVVAILGAICLQGLVDRPRERLAVAAVAVLLAGLAVFNAASPHGFRVVSAKNERIDRRSVVFEAWNAHSQVIMERPVWASPFWGPAETAKGIRVLGMRLVIDGSAYT